MIWRQNKSLMSPAYYSPTGYRRERGPAPYTAEGRELGVAGLGAAPTPASEVVAGAGPTPTPAVLEVDADADAGTEAAVEAADPTGCCCCGELPVPCELELPSVLPLLLFL